MSEQLEAQVNNLPLKPGVYLFKNAKGKIIYIGKANQLKKRVKSYFQKEHEDKTVLLVKEVADLDFFVTDNEVEALILEARLIRQNRPKYNIDLKDGTRYAYLKFTNQDFPRLLSVRQKQKDGAKYFGPFTDGTARENSARLLRSIFKIRTCAPKLPKNVCLQYYIGNCDAPCIGNISKKDYAKNVAAASDVLQGKTKRVIKELDQDMKTFSERKQYEQAKKRRDQIQALKRFSERQKMTMHHSYDEDIMHWIEVGDKVYLQLFKVDKGQVTGKQEFTFEAEPDIVESFIRQYYQTNAIPDTLLVPVEFEEHELLESYLTKMKGKKVRIRVPEKGEKKKLLDLVYKNLLYATEQEDQAMIGLRDKLNLSGIPYIIECFDISTIQGQYNVGSMVQFRGGEPDKNNYRRFKIKSVAQQDDFASMQEIVRRRYQRLLAENKELPHLIVIDGGRGQLNAAWTILQDLELNIPVIGLAKKEEEIYRVETEKPMKLSKKEPGLKLLQQIRDEAHRFAVSYHRLLRGKGMTGNDKSSKDKKIKK